MRRKPKVIPRGVRQLCNMFELFIDYYMTGLMCFFDDKEPFPDSEELSLLASAPYISKPLDVRVQGGNDIPYAQLLAERIMPIEQLLKRYGGIDRFRMIFSLYEATEPTHARTLKDLSRVGSLEYKNLETLAEAHNTTTTTIRRRKNRALLQLAYEIYRRDEIKIGGTD